MKKKLGVAIPNRDAKASKFKPVASTYNHHLKHVRPQLMHTLNT